MGDLNFEQSGHSGQVSLRSIRLLGGEGREPGRVTVGCLKANLFDSAQFFEIDDYAGQFSYLHGTPYPERKRGVIELIHTGKAPIDVLIGATETHHTSLPILVDAADSLRLTMLGNTHTRHLPSEWYGGGARWVEGAKAQGPNHALEFDGTDDFLLGPLNEKFAKKATALTVMTRVNHRRAVRRLIWWVTSM